MMKNSNFISIFFAILISHSKSSEIENKDFETLLDDPEVATVGILHSAYSNSKLPESAWVKCEYCTICPTFEDKDLANVTSNYTSNFMPCPEYLTTLSNNIKHENDYIRDVWDRYTSAFMGLAHDNVVVQRRVFSRNGPHKPLYKTKQILIPEMNVTLNKFKLEKVEFDAVIRSANDIKKTWTTVSFYDPISGPRLVFGDASFAFKKKGWKGMGTETVTLWPIKEGLTRKTVLNNLMEILELRNVGCNCIKTHLGSQFTGTVQELEKICVKSLDLRSELEDFRVTFKLTNCLIPGEEEELRAKKPAEETEIHEEL